MRTRMIACLLATMLMPTIAQAVTRYSNEEILAKAEAAFRQGVESQPRLLEARKHFSRATDYYLQLNDGPRYVSSPGLYRSLGNAAMLADRWPEAIWAYQCGLRLDPNDRTMRDHLAFARAKVLYPPAGQGRPERETWPDWLHRPTVKELLWFGGSSYILFCIIGTCAIVKRQQGLLVLTIMLGLVTTGAAAGFWHELRQVELDRQTGLVVLVQNADFYRGNATSYPKHYTTPLLPRGLEARQLHVRGRWLQIRLTTGETGWVHENNVLRVHSWNHGAKVLQ